MLKVGIYINCHQRHWPLLYLHLFCNCCMLLSLSLTSCRALHTASKFHDCVGACSQCCRILAASYCLLVQQCFQRHCCYCLLLLAIWPPPLQLVNYCFVSTHFLVCLCCCRDRAKVVPLLSLPLLVLAMPHCCCHCCCWLLLSFVIAIIIGWLLLFLVDFLICYFCHCLFANYAAAAIFPWCCNCSCWHHHSFAAHYTTVSLLLPLPAIAIATGWLLLLLVFCWCRCCRFSFFLLLRLLPVMLPLLGCQHLFHVPQCC